MSEVTRIVYAGQLVAAHDQPAVSGGAVAIGGELIHDIGTLDELSAKYPGAQKIGGSQFLLIPGLINAHTHGKGLSDFQRGALDNTLETWRFDTYDKFIPLPTYEDVAYSAAKLLKSGVTGTMHNMLLADTAGFEKKYEDLLNAYRDAGMRVLFCPAISNNNPYVYGENDRIFGELSKNSQSILSTAGSAGALTAKNYVRVVRDLHSQYQGSMSRIGFGPVAPQWCTEDLLLEIRHAADSLGILIHTHALQTIFQKIYALKFFGKSMIEYMNDLGLLGPSVVIGHCVYPTESDVDLLARTDTGVTHHASCNLRVRNGIAPAFHMLQSGVRIGIGIDSKGINDDEDFIQEMKLCYLLQRIASLELDSPYLGSRQVLQMGTEIGAGLIGYQNQLGRLEPGRYADMVLLDYNEMCRPFVDPSQDPIDILLYRGKSSHVHTVVVNGQVVVESGRLLTLNEEAIGSRLAYAASRPRTATEKGKVQAMDELKAQVIRYYQSWPTEVDFDPFFIVNSRIDGLKQQ
ncbi:MAG: amidohydrolase family protein [Gammaproteobacteria bacterium]|nr:amidohydrolase family protein [Gammaproteobacteria bacterium]